MSKSDNQAVTILVVDRDPLNGRQIRDTLLNDGFRCQHVATASSALSRARVELPSLMLIDAQLDDGTGFELIQAVKNVHACQEIPVIFMSDARTGNLIRESHDAGGLYYLSKPIDPQVLLELVDKALWLPHLIRRHIDVSAHRSIPKAPRVLTRQNRAYRNAN